MLLKIGTENEKHLQQFVPESNRHVWRQLYHSISDFNISYTGDQLQLSHRISQLKFNIRPLLGKENDLAINGKITSRLCQPQDDIARSFWGRAGL